MTPRKTVLITGTSSGIGKAAVERFARAGWTVIATMREPAKAPVFEGPAGSIRKIALDVTDPASIATAVAEAITAHGPIDVAVNNAGYGIVGPFEAFDEAALRRVFETNVFGLMAVCRAVLPHMRERGAGTIVNVASVGGRMAFPYYSLYHATKWAVEGFSESLAYELRPFGIAVKIIEPGPIATDFYGRSEVRPADAALGPYGDRFRNADSRMKAFGRRAPGPAIAADAIFDAATDTSSRLRYSPNGDGILFARRFVPDILFRRGIRRVVGA